VLILDYKLRVNQAQSHAIDEAIRTVQFIRNKCLRLWMDRRGMGDNALQVYCSQLAKEYPFAARLNSQARQTSADRTWLSIARFYKNCREKKPGKKGYPRFQHDNRSVEYKHTGWRLEPDGQHVTCTDGMGIGTVRLIGANPRRKKARPIATFPLAQIKRARLAKRADGYYAQLAVTAERSLPHAPTGKQIGIDVGLKSFYTDSEGQTVANPRYLRKAEKRLKRLHAVSPRFTTQDCSGCGYRVQKSLSQRTHVCPRCGLIVDRDWNAALNILLAALAWVAAHRTVGQAGMGSGMPEQNAWGQTDRLYAGVRKGTAQAGRMNEESPAFKRERVNFSCREGSLPCCLAEDK
jgi:transposase